MWTCPHQRHVVHERNPINVLHSAMQIEVGKSARARFRAQYIDRYSMLVQEIKFDWIMNLCHLMKSVYKEASTMMASH